MWSVLSAHPIATLSSAALYLFLLALAIPETRRIVAPWFSHPIPPHQQYLRGFDTLRGLAAAFVALGHCWWMTYPVFASTQLVVPALGYASKGVPIFAALSGFLIYRSVVSIASLAKLREYAIRRTFRIYPIYLLGVLLCLLTGQYRDPEGFRLLTSDLFMFSAISWPDGFANPPTWSLYIEVIFYALLPMVVVLFGQRRMLVGSIIVLIAMIVADNQSRVFSLWKYFLVGIIASELAPRLKAREALILLSVGLAVFATDLGWPDFDPAVRLGLSVIHGDGQTIGLALACGLILVALPSLPKVGAALNVLPLRILGIISYSVYITQFFYIQANFPEIELFKQAGTQQMYQHFLTIRPFPAWYMPFIFFPGLLFWGGVSFLLIESPGMRLGKWLIDRSRALPEGLRAPAE
jgi:peptidoglycan/LPS O-acetylase OafA/YrhL